MSGAWRRRVLGSLAVLLLGAGLPGCAGSPGGAKPVGPTVAQAEIDAYDGLALRVVAAETLSLDDGDLGRIAALVVTKIGEREPLRFTIVETADGVPPVETPDADDEAPAPSMPPLIGAAVAAEPPPEAPQVAPSPPSELPVQTPVAVLAAELAITRYDAGNAFARFMLAGLGQIRIDARLDLRDQSTGRGLGVYEIDKTFAWGGIYGGVTSIEDVEHGFAEAVATVLLGAETAAPGE